MGLKLHGSLSGYLLKIRRIGVALVTLTHPCMAPSLFLTLVPRGEHIPDKDNITVTSRFHRDIKNGLEPQMLDPVLTLLIQWQMQVVGLALEVESEDIFIMSCLTMTYQEDTIEASVSFQH